ncbi:MAG: sugar-binding domain-containing protein [Acidobacteriota bacterium]
MVPSRLSVFRVAASVIAILLTRFVAAHAQGTAIPRAEHPRPDLVRATWQSLNGLWEFEFDDQDHGIAERWYSGDRKLARTIQVPYAFQSKLSGIADPSFHDVVWYRRSLRIPEGFAGKRSLLNFGAVDYEATVWVNGQQATWHRGGHVGFGCDITDFLKPGENFIVVRVVDPSTDRSIPRGKQFWEPKSRAIWYTRTTGIWQPVWIEAAGATHIARLRITPDVDNSQVSIESILNRPQTDLKVRTTVKLNNEIKIQSEITVTDTRPTSILKLASQQLWSPERPTLYDLTVELLSGSSVIDRVESYFGQRKVSTHDGKVYLNNSPYYLRMVLDQGYWPESLMTPPTEEAIKYDIEMMKKFGFNGARKHQKVEDPRWLYWCDKLGLIVWGEMANAYDVYHDDYVARFVDEWQQAVRRDYNHPSIIAWTPINESWGVTRILTNAEQQAHAKTMYYLTRSLDGTRLVQDNDGWEHTDATDLFGIHDYARTGILLTEKYKDLERERTSIPRNGREALALGYKYNGTPILMTEFGGISYRVGAQKADNEWGYSGIEPTKEALLERLDGLIKALRANKAIAGYCYTQLTDVEQEINGLMTYDRKPKADPAEFFRILSQ